MSRERRSILAVNLGLAANALLAILKTLVGIVGNSQALLADGINSTSDVAYYLAVRVFVKMASEPPDSEHPFGHGQFESIGAVVVGSFVITTAIAIFWNAVNNVYKLLCGRADYGGATDEALIVALFTIAVKVALTIFTQRVGVETKNPAILALTYDHRNDIFSASAVAIGIFLGRMGYPWVDPLAGAVVALVILRTGIEILRESSEDLMGTVPGQSLAERVSGVLGHVPGVEEIEEIRAYRFGPYLAINLTIGVDGSLSVAEGDAIASQVEESLHDQIEFLRSVHVHYHPVSEQTPNVS